MFCFSLFVKLTAIDNHCLDLLFHWGLQNVDILILSISSSFISCEISIKRNFSSPTVWFS